MQVGKHILIYFLLSYMDSFQCSQAVGAARCASMVCVLHVASHQRSRDQVKPKSCVHRSPQLSNSQNTNGRQVLPDVKGHALLPRAPHTLCDTHNILKTASKWDGPPHGWMVEVAVRQTVQQRGTCPKLLQVMATTDLTCKLRANVPRRMSQSFNSTDKRQLLMLKLKKKRLMGNGHTVNFPPCFTTMIFRPPNVRAYLWDVNKHPKDRENGLWPGKNSMSISICNSALC